MEGRAVELHRELRLRPGSVDVEDAEGELDLVLQPRRRKARSLHGPEPQDLEVALAAGTGVAEELAERRQARQMGDGGEPCLDGRNRGPPLPGRAQRGVAGRVDGVARSPVPVRVTP